MYASCIFSEPKRFSISFKSLEQSSSVAPQSCEKGILNILLIFDAKSQSGFKKILVTFIVSFVEFEFNYLWYQMHKRPPIIMIYQPLYTVVNTDTRALPLLQQPFQTRFLLRYIPAQRLLINGCQYISI